MVISFFIGSIQSASRVMMTNMLGSNDLGKGFGLFSFSIIVKQEFRHRSILGRDWRKKEVGRGSSGSWSIAQWTRDLTTLQRKVQGGVKIRDRRSGFTSGQGGCAQDLALEPTAKNNF